MTRSIRILIVDDHALVRESLASRLSAEPDLEVVGTAPNADHTMRQVRETSPDVVLLDIDMPGLNCFDAASRLTRSHPDVHILYLSAFWNDRYIEQALATNASGYLTKLEPPSKVITAIRKIAEGDIVFSQEVRSRIVVGEGGFQLAKPQQTPLSSLTPREHEVLRYLAGGLSRRRIASTMHISEKTVAAHAGSIMNKLGIHDRVELTRYAIREGLAQL
jgi:DNA-binding NarL/FixJ family response regulator